MVPRAQGGTPATPKTSTIIELIGDIEWRTSTGVIEYPDAIRFMEARAGMIRGRQAPEAVWLLEHPPIYTAGTSADKTDLLMPDRLPVYTTGRGGEYTYHGPGQRIAYVMLDLNKRSNDIRTYVRNLEEWIISSLNRLGVKGERRKGRVGIWVSDGKGEEKKNRCNWSAGPAMGNVSRHSCKCRTRSQPF